MQPPEIAALRHDLKMGQSQFATLMGVHPMTVSRWERGVTPPSPYQNAFLTDFQRAARDKAVRTAVIAALVGVGVVAAVYILLKAARKGE